MARRVALQSDWEGMTGMGKLITFAANMVPFMLLCWAVYGYGEWQKKDGK